MNRLSLLLGSIVARSRTGGGLALKPALFATVRGMTSQDLCLEAPAGSLKVASDEETGIIVQPWPSLTTTVHEHPSRALHHRRPAALHLDNSHAPAQDCTACSRAVPRRCCTHALPLHLGHACGLSPAELWELLLATHPRSEAGAPGVAASIHPHPHCPPHHPLSCSCGQRAYNPPCKQAVMSAHHAGPLTPTWKCSSHSAQGGLWLAHRYTQIHTDAHRCTQIHTDTYNSRWALKVGSGLLTHRGPRQPLVLSSLRLTVHVHAGHAHAHVQYTHTHRRTHPNPLPCPHCRTLSSLALFSDLDLSCVFWNLAGSWSYNLGQTWAISIWPAPFPSVTPLLRPLQP